MLMNTDSRIGKYILWVQEQRRKREEEKEHERMDRRHLSVNIVEGRIVKYNQIKTAEQQQLTAERHQVLMNR